LANHEIILREGNHRHEESCIHHFAALRRYRAEPERRGVGEEPQDRWADIFRRLREIHERLDREILRSNNAEPVAAQEPVVLPRPVAVQEPVAGTVTNPAAQELVTIEGPVTEVVAEPEVAVPREPVNAQELVEAQRPAEAEEPVANTTPVDNNANVLVART